MNKPPKRNRIIKSLMYLSGCLGMINVFKNWIDIPLSVIGFIDFKKGHIMKLRNGVFFKVVHFMETLTINEIFNNDDYKIKNLKNNSVVIDIGANIGVFSVYIANKIKTPSVFSFEPSRKTFNQLIDNVRLNRFEKTIVPINCAVGGKRGTTKLYDAGISGVKSIYQTRNERKFEPVRIITLEDIFVTNNIRKCDLLKIDCEGAEYEILSNCPNSIYKRISNIAMEFHEIIPGQNHLILVNLLKSKGFTVKHFYHSIENNIGYIYAKK